MYSNVMTKYQTSSQILVKYKQLVNLKHAVSKYLNISGSYVQKRLQKQHISCSPRLHEVANLNSELNFFLPEKMIFYSSNQMRYTKFWYLTYTMLKTTTVGEPRTNSKLKNSKTQKFNIQNYYLILTICNFLFFNISKKNGGPMKIRGYYNIFPNWMPLFCEGHNFIKLRKKLLNSTITFLKYIKSFFIKFTLYL